MTREEIIKGVKGCVGMYYGFRCGECPYGPYSSDCVASLHRDVERLMEAETPRVLTLDEVEHFVYGNPYIIEMVLSDGEYRLMYGLFSHKGVVGNCDFVTVNERIRLYDADYGKTWRAWTGSPTLEQRWQK